MRGVILPPWSSLSTIVPVLFLDRRTTAAALAKMSSATGVPPPLPTLQLSTAVTATDHGQIVVLVAWLCFTAGILLSLVRVYIRWPLNALAGKDDATYAVSAILAIIQTAITIDAVSNGFGRTESELDGTQAVDAAKVSRSPRCRSDDPSRAVPTDIKSPQLFRIDHEVCARLSTTVR